MQMVQMMLGLGVGALLTWWIVRYVESSKHLSRIHELETQVRFGRGESSELKEQMLGLRHAISSAERTLNEERLDKANVVARMSQSFKKGMLVFGTVYLFSGVLLGGTASWFWSATQTDSQMTRRVMEKELTMRIAELKAELLGKQMISLENKVNGLESELLEVRVEKTIAQTKLRILLDSLSHERGIQGFVIDYEKMKKNLKKEIKTGKMRGNMLLMGSAPV